MRGTLTRTLLIACATALICLAPAVATAQRPGPGPTAGPATTLTTFQTDDFSGSGVCAMCHSGLTDQEPKDVSNDAHWRSTMMANAAKDPLWQAKISSEVDRASSEWKQVIEEKCSRCHMGMARYQQLVDGATEDDIYVLDTGFLDSAHYLHEAAMDGVSCTLCHQVQPDKLGTPDSYTGKYVIDTSSFPPDRLIFGPYQEPFGNPMQQASGFNPVSGAQIEDSAHCGSCHTLYTPTLDADGIPQVEEFPEQTTYLEWDHSTVAETCQDCHLPQAVGAVVISNRPPWLAPRVPFWQHHFVGGNSFMVELLKANAGDIGVTADAAHLDATILRTRALLAGETAALTVSADRAGDLLTVTVDVVNHAGHKLPSGLPSRRAWLHLLVTKGSNVVFESGKPRGDGGIVGNDADEDLTTWEPHYDLITSPDQVQIYEPIMLNTDGEVTYTLLRADSYAKDNRLLPAGFYKDTAGPDIAVHGVPADDVDFQGGSDRVVYEVDISGVNGSLHVTVELLFQSVSYPFVTDLNENPTQLVNRFMGMYVPTANKEEVLAQIQMTVP